MLDRVSITGNLYFEVGLVGDSSQAILNAGRPELRDWRPPPEPAAPPIEAPVTPPPPTDSVTAPPGAVPNPDQEPRP